MLFDRLRNGPWSPNFLVDARPDAREFARALRIYLESRMRNVVVVDASNVADWYYVGTDQEEFNPEDFPNIAPPWPSAFYEWPLPKVVNSRQYGGIVAMETIHKQQGIPAGVTLGRHGVFVEDITSGLTPNDPFSNYMPVPTTAQWVLRLWTFAEVNGEMVGPIFCFVDFVDAEGRWIPPYPMMMPGATQTGDIPLALIDNARSDTHVGRMAMSFLHCKNVVVEAHETPARLQRARERQHKTPLATYHTLDVRPMAEVIRKAGGHTDRKQALHLVRGYFRTYQDEPGHRLFGRIAGTFFTPMHASGSPAAGVVGKGYRVHPRKE